MWRVRYAISSLWLRALLAPMFAWSIWLASPAGQPLPALAQTDIVDALTLLLTHEDAGAVATLTNENQGEDGQTQWARRRWERDRESPDATSGPIVLENGVFVTHNVAAAQQIYAAEVAKSASVPEATDRHTGSYAFRMTPLGDESAAISVCNDCNAKDEIFVHHRIVVRKGAVVTVVYTYGTDQVVTQELATWFAGQAAARIPGDLAAAGGSPASESAQGTATGSAEANAAPGSQGIQARPQDLAIKLSEAGKAAAIHEEKDGSDDRSSWYLVRYERPRTFAGYRGGPVTIVNQVFVARDRAAADQIFQEQVKRNEAFPEAKENVGGRFELKAANEIGHESRGLSACNASCKSKKEIYLHKRLVSRVENVVSVVYIWGLANEEGVTDDNARHFASLVAARLTE